MLELRSVTAGYGRTRVLHDVSITVPTGRAVAVMGLNGAGKTTLLRVAMGLLPIASGSIVIDGEDVTGTRPSERVRRGLGYVPQGQLSFPTMTTRENLQLVAPKNAAAIDQILDLFPALRAVLDRRAGLLSGGQRQQLAIGRALLTKPKLLILDEPTEGIAPNVVAEIERTILELNSTGELGVLLVEQHVGFSLRAAEHFYVLESGRITGSGEGGNDAGSRVRSMMAV